LISGGLADPADRRDVFLGRILVRGLWSRLPDEHPGNLPYLFLYSALSIPLFYAVGMVFARTSTSP